jgi:hypothetical protein
MIQKGQNADIQDFPSDELRPAYIPNKQKHASNFAEMGQVEDTDEDVEIEAAKLSYKELMYAIRSRHPRHPLTGEPYSMGQKVSVPSCCLRMLDPFGIAICCSCCISCYRFALKSLRGDPKDTEDPLTINENERAQLDTGNEDEDEKKEFGGLGEFNAVSSRLGIGAGIYI